MSGVGEPDLEPLLRHWRAHDRLFHRVDPVWWGAVVSDPRFPRLYEMNYARVEAREAVGLAEVEERLLPAIARAGANRPHVVVFHPQRQTELVVEASSRGERIVWDLVMEHRGGQDHDDPRVTEARTSTPSFWAAHRASLRWFDITDEEVADQLETVEREVLIPAGRRWFAAVEEDAAVALASLLVLDGVGWIDHVVTFPSARRRGLATAITRRAVEAATSAGAERTYLLAESDGVAVAMYERIGFRSLTQIASWTSEPPSDPA
jgi:ribosomal protein S18 acetylase RimI-like enzyme